MRVLRHYEGLAEDARGAVVVIGNFDGIHRGHQEVIAKAGRLAHEFSAPLAVLTFEPHPRTYFNADSPPFRLTPFRIKARLIEALGVDLMYVINFTKNFAKLSAEDFIVEVLNKGLGVRYVVVGDNFHFGRGRAGDVKLLETMARDNGFGVTYIERLTIGNAEAYSSTYVRDYLRAGNPTRAALLLGRYWEIEGRVQPGAQRGRDLGYPTANIDMSDVLEPAFGVYAVRAGIDEGARTVWHAGVANLGIRPMFRSEKPLLEVHLFDFSGDLYGRHMRVALVDYLRPEMNFDGVDALCRQMEEDCRRARASLAMEDWDQSWPVSPFMSSPTDKEA